MKIRIRINHFIILTYESLISNSEIRQMIVEAGMLRDRTKESTEQVGNKSFFVGSNIRFSEREGCEKVRNRDRGIRDSVLKIKRRGNRLFYIGG